MWVCVCTHTQSCLTLCNPMGHSPPGFSVHGLFQARILEWVAISSSGGILPTQESNLRLLHCKQILYHWASREAWSVSRTRLTVILLDLIMLLWRTDAKTQTPLNVTPSDTEKWFRIEEPETTLTSGECYTNKLPIFSSVISLTDSKLRNVNPSGGLITTTSVSSQLSLKMDFFF